MVGHVAKVRRFEATGGTFGLFHRAMCPSDFQVKHFPLSSLSFFFSMWPAYAWGAIM